MASTKQRVRQLHSIFQSRARADKEVYLDSISEEVGGFRNNHIEVTYKAVKLLSTSRYIKMTVPVNKTDGQSVRGREEALERWREFYEQMLNHPPVSSC